MTEKGIKVSELYCYKNADEEMKQKCFQLRNRYFKTYQIHNTGLREQMEDYIVHRGKVLRLRSIKPELANFNQWCRFVNETLPDLDDVTHIIPEELERNCKEWLSKNRKRNKKACGTSNRKKGNQAPPLLVYTRILSDYYREPGENEIKIKALACYENADENQRQKYKAISERCFDLRMIPSERLREQMREYILHRGTELKLSSMRRELDNYNNWCKVINDMLPGLNSLQDIEIGHMEHLCRKWLMKNKRVVRRKREYKALEKEFFENASLIQYIHQIYRYYKIDESIGGFDKDVWVLDSLGIDIRYNPVNKVKTISFKEIVQPGIRSEAKQVMKIHLRKEALGTVQCELIALRRFSRWLEKEYPEVESLVSLDRDIIEDYLFYTNTEATGKKSYSSDLKHLKSVITETSFIMDVPALDNLFLNTDIGKETRTIYRSYSETEMDTLTNAIISEMDEQMARAMLVHQLLGTRISETLTIEQDSIRKNMRGKDVVDIYQIKTHKKYTKILNDDVLRLLRKSIEYTNDKYGKQKYVFVNGNIPDEPMQYDRIRDELRRVIIKNDLRDDHLERFGVGTHIMRHTYARKLTELHVDDVTIAKLLGQSGLSSLKYYRQIRPEKLYKETKPVLDEINEEMSKILEEWNGEE